MTKTAYQIYLRAFARDMHKVAVWPPGDSVELGDYGKFQDKEWLRLGSIWDLVPQLKRSDVTTTSSKQFMQMGSAELVHGSADASYKDQATVSARLSIKFTKDNSVFATASKCDTKSLKHVQTIAEVLSNSEKWDKSWNFVSELCSAGTFQVVINQKQGDEAKVEASSSELLETFTNGTASTSAGISISGSAVNSYIGKSGPVYMGLIKVKKGWLGKTTASRDVERYADDDDVAFEVVDPEEVLQLCGAH